MRTVGVRTWLAGAIVVCSVLDPALVSKYAPYVAVLIFLTGQPSRFRITGTVFAAVALLGWMWLSLQWSINPLANQDVLIWTSLIVVFLCLQDLIKDRHQLRFLAVAYLVGVFASVVLTIGTNFGAILGGEGDRYSADQLNANYLGYAYIVGLAMVVLLWVTKELTFANKAGLVVTAVAIIVGIELTGTRGAEVGAVCLIAWLLACKAFKRPPIRLLLVVLAAVSVVIGTGVADATIGGLDFGARATGDLSGRLTLWPIARELWGMSPWVGNGMWAMRSFDQWGVDAHNVFLEIGSSLGIIGVILFVTLLWVMLGPGTKQLDTRLRFLLIGSLLAVSAPAYLSGAWEPTSASWAVLVIFSRISVLANTPYQSENPSQHLRSGRTRTPHRTWTT